MVKPILIAAALAAAAIPTAAAAGPAFEVASVKIAAPCCDAGQWRESRILEDRIDFRYVTLRYCIAAAWRVKEYQVSGPPWITETRYDILAKAPAGARRDQIPEMIQTMLAERFHLAVHKEQKEYSVMSLTVAKGGHKLKEAPPSPDPTAGANYGISMNSSRVGRIECHNADMQSLANTLVKFVGKPVVNQTNLAGRYEFEIEFSPEDMSRIAPPPPVDYTAGPAAQVGVSIFTSIQRLGLRLDSQKLPLDTIVVDAGQKDPIEN